MIQIGRRGAIEPLRPRTIQSVRYCLHAPLYRVEEFGTSLRDRRSISSAFRSWRMLPGSLPVRSFAAPQFPGW